MIKIKKAIITGATGLIGRELVKILATNNVEVLAIIRPNSPNIGFLKSSPLLKTVECDINNLESLEKNKNLTKYDVFFHFAWQGVYGAARDDVSLQCRDIKNTLSAVKVAKKLGCAKFIGAGSQAEVGLVNEKISSNTVGNPFTAYGIAKKASLQLAKILTEKEDMYFNWGRILSVYGPNDSMHTMVMSMLNKMIAGENCDLTSGEQIWDFLFSKDAAQAFYDIAKSGINGKVYPVASGNGKPLKEFVLQMHKTVGNNSCKLNFGAIPFNNNSIKYLCGDTKDILADTGFKPTTAFEDGIKQTIESISHKN